MKKIAVILSGGQGSRMGADLPKQYMEIKGMPIIAHTLWAFEKCPLIDEIILVTLESDIDYCQKEIVNKYNFRKVTKVIAGGYDRAESSNAGIKAIDDQEAYVFIHDGARPIVSAMMLERLNKDVEQYKATIAAVPTKDTVKISDFNGMVIDTPNRQNVWIVQTPQCFDINVIRNAFEGYSRDDKSYPVTDDASLVEKYGDIPVHITMGDYGNIKVTTPEDLVFAEAYL